MPRTRWPRTDGRHDPAADPLAKLARPRSTRGLCWPHHLVLRDSGSRFLIRFPCLPLRHRARWSRRPALPPCPADYSRFAGDLPEPAPLSLDRDSLIPALKSYFDHHGLSADWEAIDRANDEALVTCLAMACPFEPSEKQALLECPSETELAAMMQALFEMAAHSPAAPRQRVQ